MYNFQMQSKSKITISEMLKKITGHCDEVLFQR